MKTSIAVFTAGLALLAAPAGLARADVLSLHAEVHGGGAAGKGLDGDVTGNPDIGIAEDEAFHAKTRGATYGALVGVEFLFVDAWVEHNQYMDGDGLLGTWSQFMGGLDLELDLGEKVGATKKKGKLKGGYSQGYFETGLAVGFGVGTLNQVEPPLDNRQIEDKGFIGQASIGAGYRLNRILSLGVSVPVQFGYMFKSGGPANLEDNQYVSVQAAALLNLRMKFKLK